MTIHTKMHTQIFEEIDVDIYVKLDRFVLCELFFITIIFFITLMYISLFPLEPRWLNDIKSFLRGKKGISLYIYIYSW